MALEWKHTLCSTGVAKNMNFIAGVDLSLSVMSTNDDDNNVVNIYERITSIVTLDMRQQPMIS